MFDLQHTSEARNGIMGLPGMTLHQVSGICVVVIHERALRAETDYSAGLNRFSNASQPARPRKGKELCGLFVDELSPIMGRRQHRPTSRIMTCRSS